MHVKQNVLHLIDSFHQGGSERQAVQLLRLLHESGQYRMHVACLDGGGVLRGEVERLGLGEIPEFRLTSFYDRNALAQLRRLANWFRERRIDIVHTHDFYTNVFGMAAATLARVPVRIASRRETLGMRSNGQKVIERCAFRMAHAIVANAIAVRDQLIAEGVSAKKIQVVYNGLDMARISLSPNLRREEILTSFDLPQEKRFVTIVANLRHPVKDHPMFLRAAKQVRAAVSDAAFVLAGEGELMPQLREFAAEIGLTNDVFFTGRCEKVAELLSVSEICVLSSKAEGFSNSLLEYMAAGKPVVATDVGGARETVVEAETGYLVASGDDQAMAERLVSLLNHSEKTREMGERGRMIVENNFSCQAQLERTEELYSRLLSKESRLPRVMGKISQESV